MFSIEFVCVHVGCVTKNLLFTHLLVKFLHEKGTNCSLIHFICHQRCLLDLLNHKRMQLHDFSSVPRDSDSDGSASVQAGYYVLFMELYLYFGL